MITQETRGLVLDLNNEDYHIDREFISSTGLKLLKETCPSTYKCYYIDNQERKTSFSKSTGSASHTSLLEGYKFNNEYYVALDKVDHPEALKTTEDIKVVLKAAGLKVSGKKDDLIERARDLDDVVFWDDLTKAHYAANVGKICISVDQMEIVQGINKSIQNNSKAMELLSTSKKEVSLFGKGSIYPNILKKVRFDLLGDTWFGDFKTAKSASEEYFQNSTYKFYYDLQFAMYADLFEEEYGQYPDIWVIVAETVPPFNVSTFQVGEDVLYYGPKRYKDSLETLDECRFSGQWPDYQGSKKAFTLKYPGWAYRKLENQYGEME